MTVATWYATRADALRDAQAARAWPHFRAAIVTQDVRGFILLIRLTYEEESDE